ncbi:MAG: hypothetical protein ACR2MG_03885 [Pyrinomonadaceae bacterium]
MNKFKENNTFVLIGIFAVIICSLTAVLFRHLQVNEVEAQSQTTLTLEVSTPQRKYVLNEPFLLDFKLSNQTTVPITWNGIPMLGARDVVAITRSEDGNEIKWDGRRSSIDGFMDTEIMESNKNKEIQNLIYGGILDHIFPQPGRYQLRIEFRYLDLSYGQKQDVTIISNPIMIEITEPRGKDRLAYDYLKNIYEPVDRRLKTEELIPLQQRFVDNFSDTVYGKYMTFKLAENYMLTKQYKKAEDEFYKISDIDFYYSKRVDDQLRELAGKLHRPNRRTKRLPDLSNIPVARELPPSPPPPSLIYTASPLPGNAPVLIRIPNPNPNSTP